MMREILFRGKQCRTGKWVYGYLSEDGCGLPVIETARFRSAVEPDTIGQYTCLTDKNGHRIFEGDIVSFNYDTGSVEMTDGCWGLDDGGTLLYDLEELEVIGNIHDNLDLKGD